MVLQNVREMPCTMCVDQTNTICFDSLAGLARCGPQSTALGAEPGNAFSATTNLSNSDVKGLPNGVSGAGKGDEDGGV